MNRKLSWLLAVLVLASGHVAEAQQPKKIPRVGYLAAVSASADAPRLEAFRQGLRDLGYIEGQNIIIEYRHEAGGFERLPDLAAELVRLQIDVLVAVTTNAALAAKKTTGTIPIVFMGVTDPVTAGLVDSLARPGGEQHRNHQHGGDFNRQATGVTQRNYSQGLPCCGAVGSTGSRLHTTMERKPTAGAGTGSATLFDGGKQR